MLRGRYKLLSNRIVIFPVSVSIPISIHLSRQLRCSNYPSHTLLAHPLHRNRVSVYLSILSILSISPTSQAPPPAYASPIFTHPPVHNKSITPPHPTQVANKSTTPTPSQPAQPASNAINHGVGVHCTELNKTRLDLMDFLLPSPLRR